MRHALAALIAFLVLAASASVVHADILTYVGTTTVQTSPDPSIPAGTAALLTLIVPDVNHFEGDPAYPASTAYYMGQLWFDVLDRHYSTTANLFVNCNVLYLCTDEQRAASVTNVIVYWSGPGFGSSFIPPLGPPQSWAAGYSDPTSPELPAHLWMDIYIPFTEGPAMVAHGSVNLVPEPASLLLLGTGLAGLVRWRKRRP